MPDWFDRIDSAVRSAGFETRVWSVGAGRLLITPFAARVLSCRMDGVEGDLFWHNMDIERAEKAKAIMNSAGGGLGGDRLWLGPEIGFSWPDIKKARISPWDSYKVPRQMDPADWHIAEEAQNHLRLTAEMTMRDGRIQKSVTVRLARQFNVIDAPPNLPAGVKSLSFSIRNELAVLAGDDGAVVGTWDLLQLPAGGTLVCPTLGPVSSPRIYYGAFDPQRMSHDDRAFRFQIDGKRQLKFGLTPWQTTGRAGYHRPVGGGISTLIFRTFGTQPGEPYIDLPLTSDDLTGGDALQSYNDGGQFGGFGEMEYHDPGVIVGRSPETRSSSNTTHILAGPDAAIREAAKVLLGVPV
ncbi:MAG: hypothetical protein K8S99_18145 [Planctomycetes bacterium]|nr:hypothetical protein [Planctomycetota bacterium]